MSLENIIQKIENAKADESEVSYNQGIDKCIEIIEEIIDEYFIPENLNFHKINDNGFYTAKSNIIYDSVELHLLSSHENEYMMKGITKDSESGTHCQPIFIGKLISHFQAEIIFRSLGIIE